MSKILDYTSPISPAALKLADVSGVCRYLSWPALSWKTIKQPEYDALIGAGLRVFLNWEAANTDWMSGSVGGMSHAKEAVRTARALGYPLGSVILGSADFDMTRKQWDGPCRFYARGFANVIQDAGYRPGDYGPYDVIQWVSEEGIMDAHWQAGMSWAWSGEGALPGQSRNRKVHPKANLIQRGHLTVAGHDTDWNEILTTPLWEGKGKDEPTVYLIDILISGTAPDQVNKTGLLYDDGSFHHIAKMEALNWVIANVAPKNLGTMWDWEAVDRFGINLTPESGTTVNVDVTQDQLNTAIGANTDKFGASFASHVKIV